jgi:hypothetical protein
MSETPSSASLLNQTAGWLAKKPAILVELLLSYVILIPYTVTPLLFGFGWLSLWLRRVRWSDIGLRRPRRWWFTVLLAVPLGCGWPLADIYVVEPWLVSLTGEPVDLSILAGIKENVAALVIMLVVVWTLAAFGEELTFRGYLFNRTRDLVGQRPAGTAAALIVVSLSFGIAHTYQGITGMIETGYVGMGLGVLYLWTGRNLWLPFLVHGIYDTVGIVLIYQGRYPGL